MKKILFSLITIGVVGGLAFGATSAFFTDVEKSEGNTITAGTIDISVDENNPWSTPVTIDDMKPSFVRWTRHVVRNVGNNPLKLWKHIDDVATNNNGWSEEECTEAIGTWQDPECIDPQQEAQNDIHKYIEYDMYIGGTIVDGDEQNDWLGGHNENGTVIIDEVDGITLHDIESVFVYLGELIPDEDFVVWQSYHMKDETGNWAQTDQVSFTIEFFAEQVNGNGPIAGGVDPQTLLLENKNTGGDWSPVISDGMWGVLKWAGDGTTFDFSTTLEAHGLDPDTGYSLVYAPDPWPQSLGGPSTELGSATSDGDGNLTIATSKDLGYDIPHPDDNNYPLGGKIWLVPTADHDGTKLTGWNPAKYLFEYNLITYDDTDA